MFALSLCRTHGHQEEETVAKGGRVQKEKSSSTLPSVWWTWYLFLNILKQTLTHTHTHTQTYRFVGRSAINHTWH